MAVGTAALCLTFLLVGFFVFVSAETKPITAESGQDVTLTCRAPNNNIGHVKWSRTDLGDKYVLLYQDGHLDSSNQHPSFKDRVDLQDRQMKDGDVSLILKDVKINDTGTYECHVFIEETRSWTYSFIKLSVATPETKPIKAESGQKITLPCRAPKNNISHVEWNRADLKPQYLLLYQDGQLNLSNQHPSFKNRVDLQDNWKKDGNVSLILKDVTVNDEGTYVCRVLMEETRSRKTISSIYLRVFPKPKSITAESGQKITLPCRAPKNNISHVEWNRADLKPQYLLLYQDGQLNLSNQHPSFKNRVDLQDNWKKDGNVSLILKDVKMNDSGTYECHMFMRETKTQNKDLINIINLSVRPGQTAPSVGPIVSGLLVSAVLLFIVAAVGFLIYRRCNLNPPDPHEAHELDRLQPPQPEHPMIIPAESGQDVTLTCRAVNNESEKMSQQLHQPEVDPTQTETFLSV